MVGASVVLASGWACGQAGPGQTGPGGGSKGTSAGCPDLGVELVHTEIFDVGSQGCPAVRIGPGIPFVGQLEIFAIGSRSCPVLQEQVPAHHVPVAKEGFRIAAGDTLPIKVRPVSCSSSENLVVIGTSGCEYGRWTETLTKVMDWREHLCE